MAWQGGVMTRDRSWRAGASRKERIEQAWIAEARRAGGAARFARTRARRTVSGPAIVYALCIGLLVGWSAPDWIARVREARGPVFEAAAPADLLSARFSLCHSGGGVNCVVDGDTFWFAGRKYRIADIDTPETHGPRCAAEGALGAQATTRLQGLMNAGPFTLEPADRDEDRYGRTLRIVTRERRSIGAMLVDEGLARRWDGGRHPWC